MISSLWWKMEKTHQSENALFIRHVQIGDVWCFHLTVNEVAL